jgi:hypothetical protein
METTNIIVEPCKCGETEIDLYWTDDYEVMWACVQCLSQAYDRWSRHVHKTYIVKKEGN